MMIFKVSGKKERGADSLQFFNPEQCNQRATSQMIYYLQEGIINDSGIK